MERLELERIERRGLDLIEKSVDVELKCLRVLTRRYVGPTHTHTHAHKHGHRCLMIRCVDCSDSFMQTPQTHVHTHIREIQTHKKNTHTVKTCSYIDMQTTAHQTTSRSVNTRTCPDHPRHTTPTISSSLVHSQQTSRSHTHAHRHSHSHRQAHT
jgi:hypothetical protein